MPIIDPQGLFDGERLGACSDGAKLLWPYLYCASNGYARLEINPKLIRQKCFPSFTTPPTDEEIAAAFLEFQENFLVILYEYEGKVWAQFNTAVKYLPRHKSKKDQESPVPSAEDQKQFEEGYVEWKRAKSFCLQQSRKISETFGNLRRKVRGIGVGVAVGIGTGEGVGETAPSLSTEETEEQDMKATKQIPFLCEQILGVRADLSPQNTMMLKGLETEYKSTTVLNDFTLWAKEHKYDELRKPVSAYLKVAFERLGGGPEQESVAPADHPVVKAVGREIVLLTDNVIALNPKHKAALVPIVDEFDYTFEEVMSVWRDFFQKIDVNNPKDISYAAGNFVGEASDRLYAKRRKAAEAAQQGLAVARKAEEMQREAEEERRKRAEAAKQQEELVEDTLGD